MLNLHLRQNRDSTIKLWENDLYFRIDNSNNTSMITLQCIMSWRIFRIYKIIDTYTYIYKHHHKKIKLIRHTSRRKYFRYNKIISIYWYKTTLLEKSYKDFPMYSIFRRKIYRRKNTGRSFPWFLFLLMFSTV